MANRLKHLREVTPVSDPIHGRMEFTVFERELIDSEYFQRLHFVLQNGMTFVAYPANKNTRFPHSLGVCHISGMLYTRGVQCTDTGTFEAFLEKVCTLLEKMANQQAPTGFIQPQHAMEKFRKKLEAQYTGSIAGFSSFSVRPLLNQKQEAAKRSTVAFSRDFTIETLWQALRLYALMHDIGHLPMSHAFEKAISSDFDDASNFGGSGGLDEGKAKKHFDDAAQHYRNLRDQWRIDFGTFADKEIVSAAIDAIANQFKKSRIDLIEHIKKKPVHEIRSVTIFLRYCLKTREETQGGPPTNLVGGAGEYRTLVLDVCLLLIFCDLTNDSEWSFLRAVRRLVDGEIDADRLDYTMRDGNASGSDIGRFDLGRICGNAYLLKCDDLFSFGFFERAISGIEQFFEHRYQSYKYLIQHRTSARSNRLLELLLNRVLMHAFMYPNLDCAELLDAYGYITRELDTGNFYSIRKILPDDDENILRVDDANLRTLLFRTQVKIKESLKRPFDHLSDQGGHRELEVRRKFEKEICNLIDIVLLRRFEHVVSPLDEVGTEKFLKNFTDLEQFKIKKILKGDRNFDALAKQLQSFAQSQVSSDLASDGTGISPTSVIVELLKPKVYPFWSRNMNFESGVWIIDQDGTMTPVQSRSRILQSMGRRIRKDSEIRIYLVSERIALEETNRKKIEKAFVAACQEFLGSLK